MAIRNEIKRRAAANELAVDATGYVNIARGEPVPAGNVRETFAIGGGGGRYTSCTVLGSLHSEL